ncbi:DUF6544 family protein [Histidinibacterium aquaticum]|uniref:Uncharacterized protein n=1 Tax=Histidinibacterium aquaticum TaxID=2613962 RepID=A0A5J5GR15_9RHOB|nr:DUF6544 family protein [Histidinibacterium aquaticum]KAA9009998.1 hypothetical protein F3S47_01690 [Histidinibacterium aquaticum]
MLMKSGLVVIALILAALLVLFGLRLLDARADRQVWRDLEHRAVEGPRFDPAMLDGLPEPAARFFRFAIAPGTRLRSVAVVEMGGSLSLGDREAPSPQPIVARQILAPPHGFIWQVRLESAARVTGSDAHTPELSWGRFRLLDLVPVARVSGDPDHLRSSFGRMVGEGLFWTPAAFLAETQAGWDHLSWEAVDAGTARVTVRRSGLEQTADITVDGEGRPVRVVFPRWSNENADRQYRVQPFGGDLAGFESFDGYTLPTRVTGGNHYGTALYHPFYKAEVTAIHFSE